MGALQSTEDHKQYMYIHTLVHTYVANSSSSTYTHTHTHTTCTAETILGRWDDGHSKPLTSHPTSPLLVISQLTHKGGMQSLFPTSEHQMEKSTPRQIMGTCYLGRPRPDYRLQALWYPLSAVPKRCVPTITDHSCFIIVVASEVELLS